VLEELEEKLLPYCTHVGHPGYMGLITPSPNPIGIIADFICSALNQNIGAYTIGPAGVAMERQTIRWLTDMAGYDNKAGGNLTSGGMMANFIGLKLARDSVSGDRAQHDGVQERWTVYASDGVCVRRTACFGRQSCRLLGSAGPHCVLCRPIRNSE
jgi:glutamate/tyrosine decarboxylase-like PLP-dependent enzyme